MDFTSYPFKCKPILKEKIWGGNELKDFLNKSSSNEKIGESWEVSSLPEGSSFIDNGIYKGKRLDELILAFAKAILGKPVVDKFGLKMPLLIKFIDASDKLSVQLHPDDELAAQANAENGKTEMWYVLKAKENAHIIAGFKETMNAQKFDKVLTDNNLASYLKYIPVKEGDSFYISAGLIHAIGPGIVLAEIQQPSDITYRIYDYDRKQEEGSYRELHLEQARQAIKFEEPRDLRLSYDRNLTGQQVLKHSPFFKTDIIRLKDTTHVINRSDSFTVIMVVKGSGKLQCLNKEYQLQLGDTYLIPADCDQSNIMGNDLKFLEVYL
jgi:mannose-6-phosphate isomerase